MAATRLEELDGIRGLAALGVAVMHYGAVTKTPVMWSLLTPVYERGWLFVDLFFALSGYVLCHTYLTQLADGRDFREFLVRRLARLYPLHFATLLLAVGLQFALADSGGYRSANGDAYHFALNLLLLQNSGLQAGGSFNGISWSISCEFIVNLVFAAWCLMTRPRWTVWVALAVFSLVVLMTQDHRIGEFDANYFGVFNSGLLRCALSFSLGVLVYRLATADGARRSFGYDLAFLAGVLVTLAAMTLVGLRVIPERWDFAIAAIGFPAIIYFAVRAEGPFVRFVRWRPVVWLGTISYSTYLCHMFLVDLVRWAAGKGWVPATGSVATFALFVAVTLIVAALSYRLIEVPGKRLVLARMRRRSLPIQPARAET